MNVWVVIYRAGWVALAILLVIGVASLFWPKIRYYQELQKQETSIKEENRLEEEMLKHLKTQQEKLRTDPKSVERIAREELGLAKPGETIFKFVDEEPKPAKPAAQ